MIPKFRSVDEAVEAAVDKIGDCAQMWWEAQIEKQPDLVQCKPSSVYKVLLECYSNGLSLHTEKRHAYISNTKGSATLGVMAMGKLALLFKHGVVTEVVKMGVIYKGDTYRVFADRIEHELVTVQDGKSPLEGAYIELGLRSGRTILFYLDLPKLEARRAMSKGQGSKAWTSFRDEMYLAKVIGYAYGRLSVGITADVVTEPSIGSYNEDEDVATPAMLASNPMPTVFNNPQPTVAMDDIPF